MKLSNETLAQLEAQGVSTPNYDRSQITAGVVHIGPSNFARGHIFKYIDRVLETDPSWGIRAISVKSNRKRKPLGQLAHEFLKMVVIPLGRFEKPVLPKTYEPTRKEVLEAQDYLYTVNEQSASGVNRSVVGSLMDITVAQDDPQAALNILCDPNIKLVTITVTQDGYGHNSATNTLDFERDDIQACLSNMDQPSTTVGYLVAALERRMKEGAPPLTIMSCDNMPANGVTLRNVVLDYAAERSRDLRKYVEENITFPSTMVDRIVPTTTDKDVFNARAAGANDAWPIMTEDFMQWVIEDNFAGDVPDFAKAGATITKEVEPFELMKLRMLNGAHMALGCVAGLAGHRFVDKAMNDPQLPQLKTFIKGFMAEAANTVPDIDGIDFSLYQRRLVERLQNPHMKDELVRLARNGTQKIKGRVIDSLTDARSHDLPYQHLAFATAAWIQYLKAEDDRGNPIEINDETAVSSGLQKVAINSNGSPEPVMSRSGVFDRNLMRNNEFVASVSRHLHNIQQYGVLTAIEQIDAEPSLEIEQKLEHRG